MAKRRRKCPKVYAVISKGGKVLSRHATKGAAKKARKTGQHVDKRCKT